MKYTRLWKLTDREINEGPTKQNNSKQNTKLKKNNQPPITLLTHYSTGVCNFAYASQFSIYVYDLFQATP